ncbi:MAG: hypothetical protein CBD27_08540 [Rhodospirillaceae bacterium TMED167]|nr:hypothetical protein [Rhodospirillaceae bacterium]MAI12185.1 hypothetical protein [Rhodospirillaceae bacterium]OUW24599.1 MAG: hypothetical protein CBD27_11015 [Rhodospirillaceae bacterium TMED167]OUW26083.1 MAG: hypothetical protein CBD27_08540 [Rhodospirillaceae bacterium TMED167]
MKTFMKLMVTGLLAVSLLSVNTTHSNAKQPVDFQNNSCHAAARSHERAAAIPRNLLTSIALAETGRWNAQKKEMFAWPWTVTSGGAGTYYPTRQDAIDAVQKLQSRGVTNIDVGCMQINLQYHPNAFASLDQAFDPVLNVEYAKNFLLGLQKSTGSWIQAAANYHSTSPQLNLNYRTKVLRIWREVSGVSLARLPLNPSPSPAYADPEARVAQTALLNSRFRARLDAEGSAQKHVKARDQMQAWRQARTSPNLLGHTAALRRAKMLQKQQSELENLKPSFAQKRRQQLNKWRKNPHTAFR